MESNSGRAFFAGVGSTFVILALGFGGGLMMAQSALKEPSATQSRAASVALAPVRIILPNSAEAAQPPQPSEATPPLPSAQKPSLQTDAQAPVEKEVDRAEARKAEAEERERKRRYTERKARRQAEPRARQQRETRQEAPVMAFGGDNSPRFSGNLFDAR
jgi:hypothetical protein